MSRSRQPPDYIMEDPREATRLAQKGRRACMGAAGTSSSCSIRVRKFFQLVCGSRSYFAELCATGRVDQSNWIDVSAERHRRERKRRQKITAFRKLDFVRWDAQAMEFSSGSLRSVYSRECCWST